MLLLLLLMMSSCPFPGGNNNSHRRMLQFVSVVEAQQQRMPSLDDTTNATSTTMSVSPVGTSLFLLFIFVRNLSSLMRNDGEDAHPIIVRQRPVCDLN